MGQKQPYQKFCSDYPSQISQKHYSTNVRNEIGNVLILDNDKCINCKLHKYDIINYLWAFLLKTMNVANNEDYKISTTSVAIT